MNLTDKEKKELLKTDKLVDPLYYDFGDFEYNTKSKERTLSGIGALDWLVSGFEMGCITIWTGLTNSGKTTVMTMITKKAIEQGEKVFYFNGEQTRDDFKNNLYKQSSERKYIKDIQYKQSRVFDWFVMDKNEITRLNNFYKNKLFLYNNNLKKDISMILSAMDEVRIKNKVRVFVIDNFMQIDTETSDEYREQKDIMEKLRTFAINKNIHIHLVAHPRKMIDRFQQRLTLYDVLGSSNLVNKAYNIISILRVDTMNRETNEWKNLAKEMARNGYDIEKTSTILEVLKTKGNQCGLVGLQYNAIQKTFTEQPTLSLSEIQNLQKKLNLREEDNPF